MGFLSANSGFAVQNDGTYRPRITRETCTVSLIKRSSDDDLNIDQTASKKYIFYKIVVKNEISPFAELWNANFGGFRG